MSIITFSAIKVPYLTNRILKKRSTDELIRSAIKSKSKILFSYRVKKLLDEDLDPNYSLQFSSEQGTYTLSLLHIAAHLRSRNAVKLLLKAGANPFVRDEAGRTPFLVSIKSKDKKLVTMLSSPELINQTDFRGWNALHYAFENKDTKLISLLSNKRVNPNHKPKRGRTLCETPKTPFEIANEDVFSAFTPFQKKQAIQRRKIIEKRIKDAKKTTYVTSQIKHETILFLPFIEQHSAKTLQRKKRVKHVETKSIIYLPNKTKEQEEYMNTTTKGTSTIGASSTSERKFKPVSLDSQTPAESLDDNSKKYSQRSDAKRISGQKFSHFIDFSSTDSNSSQIEISFIIADGGLMARYKTVSESNEPRTSNNSSSKIQWKFLIVEEIPTGKRNGKTQRFHIWNKDETINLYVEIIFEKEEVAPGKIRTVKNFYVHKERMLSKLLINDKEPLKVTQEKSYSDEPKINIHLEEFNLENITVFFDNGRPELVSGPIKKWHMEHDDFEEPTITKIILPVDDCIVVVSAPPDESFETPKAEIMSKEIYYAQE